MHLNAAYPTVLRHVTSLSIPNEQKRRCSNLQEINFRNEATTYYSKFHTKDQLMNMKQMQ